METSLYNQLFPRLREKEYGYLLIDPCVPGIDKDSLYDALAEAESMPLFYDTLLEAYTHISPLIIPLNSSAISVMRWYACKEHSDKGVVVLSSLPPVPFAEHLRAFLFAKRYDDRKLLLRLYDPLVMQHCQTMLSDKDFTEFMLPLYSLLYTASNRQLQTKAGGSVWTK